MELKSILETLIFVSGEVLGTSQMMETLKGVADGPQPTREELESALEELQKEWEERGSGILLDKVAQGFEFRTRSEAAPWIRALNGQKPQRLSTPAVESLALIAYRQPVTRTDIETVRGVDSGGVLKSLIERRLIRVVGRKEEPGRPILYATTKEFLELFGLRDLADLPPLKEFEERLKAQEAERPALPELSVSDLISTEEELETVAGEDKEALDDLDESLKHLKDLENSLKVLEKPEEKPDESPTE